MQERQQIIHAITATQCFQDCPDEFVDFLANQSHALTVKKGHLIFMHGDAADCFYIIQHGSIKLFRAAMDGTQAVIDIMGTGDMFGEASIFEPDAYPFSAETLVPCTLIAIPLTLLKEEIETNLNMARTMLFLAARYQKRQDLELEHRTLQNAPQRIGCYLLRLTDQRLHEPQTINLPTDKAVMASQLGMQPETFSRALARLGDKTGIQIAGSRITINSLRQLSDYVCSACSSEFPCRDLTMKNW